MKTLEEPAPGVVFVLLAEREDKLLPTIKSRCQKVIFADKTVAWQPNEDNQAFYDAVRNAERKKNSELLQLAADLGKDKEQVESLLYDLAAYARHKLGRAKAARVINEETGALGSG